jgi:hypothetical protein
MPISEASVLDPLPPQQQGRGGDARGLGGSDHRLGQMLAGQGEHQARAAACQGEGKERGSPEARPYGAEQQVERHCPDLLTKS